MQARIMNPETAQAIRRFFIPCAENGYRPKSLERRAFVAYIAIGLVLKLGFLSLFTVLPKTMFFADVTRATLISLTNQARTEKGLSPLTENSVLAKAAEDKARDILSKGYFAHESPDGKTPWYWFLREGYKYLYAGENLAIDFVESTDVVTAWLNSPAHRANIENANYRDLGIAVVTGPFGEGDATEERTVIVQLFGKPVTTPAPRAPRPAPAPSVTAPPRATAIPPARSASPLPTRVPAPSISPSALPTVSAQPLVSPTPQPAGEELAVAPAPPFSATTASVARVAGEGITPDAELASAAFQRAMPISARLFLWVRDAGESAFVLFLAFVVIASLLNVFVRRDIQHADLVVRALVLTGFFLVLVLARDQALLNLFPQVL